jgi:uncharacterized SAM-binding protein YcdF (DUF218 family)
MKNDHILRALTMLIACLALVTFTVMTRSTWLPWLYSYLDVTQPPQHADVIIVLAGEPDRRVPVATELYKQGYAPYVLVSEHSRAAQQALDTMVEEGVSPQAVILNERPGGSTWSEAQTILAMLDDRNMTSAIIVTNTWHTRRAAATYQALQGDRDMHFTFVGTDEPDAAYSWWRDKEGQSTIRSEYLKTVYYLFRYGVVSIKPGIGRSLALNSRYAF